MYSELVGSEQCEVDHEIRMSTARRIRELTTTDKQKELAIHNHKRDYDLRALELGMPFRMPLEAYAIQLLFLL